MATTVEFHTGVADPLGFACRLLRKAYRKGVRVVVAGPADVLQALDRALWTFEEREFVPHVLVDGPVEPERQRSMQSRTPIWLWRGGALPWGHPGVLVNLGSDARALAEAFARVIEIVPTDPDAAAAGRRRWREWQSAGFAVTHHPAGDDRA